MKILYIEDDKFARENLLFFLRTVADKIIAVSTAEEGLSYIQQEEFDLIITDIRLPGMSGVDFIKKLKDYMGKDFHKQPIIVTTAYKENELLVELLENLVYGVVFKPVDLEKLEALIKRALPQLIR